MASFAKVSFSKKNNPEANDTASYEGNYGKVSRHGLLFVVPGRNKKPASAPRRLLHQQCRNLTMENKHSACSVSVILNQKDVPWSTVQKIAHKVLQFYPQKIKYIQEFQRNGISERESFTFELLARMEVDKHWPWNNLQKSEVYFYINDDVNTHNYWILAKQIRHIIYPVQFNSPKVIIRCSMKISFIIESFFFEEQSTAGPITCTMLQFGLESI